MLYVDYIEVAPWNLRGKLFAPRFTGTGSLLIGEAAMFSFEQGWRGRVGLHSLPQAEEFYSRICQMTDCGRDSGYYELKYFE